MAFMLSQYCPISFQFHVLTVACLHVKSQKDVICIPVIQITQPAARSAHSSPPSKFIIHSYRGVARGGDMGECPPPVMD